MPGTVRSRIFGRLVCCLCLWIFCGYIYEVYRHACRYSVVTYTMFTDMPVDMLWLHIRTIILPLFGMGVKHVLSVWGKKISFSFEVRVVTDFGA
jgi:hypothetical protein